MDKNRIHSLNHVIKYYEKHAKNYDKDYNDYYWRLYNDLTWAFLKPYLPQNKNAKILDVGCGTARWAISLAKMGYDVIGIDLSQAMLDIADKKIKNENLEKKIKLLKGDIRDLKHIETNEFDVVLALGDVISYALDDDLAVSELFRVCKPNGICIASVDNKFVYLMNHIKFEQWSVLNQLIETGISYFFKEHPVKTYFVEDLNKLFSEHGFEIIKIYGKPVLIGSMKKKIRERKLSTNYEILFELEKNLGSNDYFIGQGGHLQIVARKSQLL